ncbi:hypothetical protein MTP99_009093 [Tenebrio molitor]|nr:hypothetical protein MTP99_009093 [Tenebrio molitor]
MSVWMQVFQMRALVPASERKDNRTSEGRQWVGGSRQSGVPLTKLPPHVGWPDRGVIWLRMAEGCLTKSSQKNTT